MTLRECLHVVKVCPFYVSVFCNFNRKTFMYYLPSTYIMKCVACFLGRPGELGKVAFLSRAYAYLAKAFSRRIVVVPQLLF